MRKLSSSSAKANKTSRQHTQPDGATREQRRTQTQPTRWNADNPGSLQRELATTFVFSLAALAIF